MEKMMVDAIITAGFGISESRHWLMPLLMACAGIVNLRLFIKIIKMEE